MIASALAHTGGFGRTPLAGYPTFENAAPPPPYAEALSIPKPDNEGTAHPSKDWELQRKLLFISSIFSLLSCSGIMALSIPLRVVALGSTLHSCISTPHSTKGDLVMAIVKVGAVALALIGSVAGKPYLYVASLSAQVGAQAIEVVRALYRGDIDRADLHFRLLAVDVLLLGAVVQGSIYLMLAAALSNAMFQAHYLVLRYRNQELDSVDLFVALIGSGVATINIVQIAEQMTLLKEKPVHGITPTDVHDKDIHQILPPQDYGRLAIGGTAMPDTLFIRPRHDNERSIQLNS